MSRSAGSKGAVVAVGVVVALAVVVLAFAPGNRIRGARETFPVASAAQPAMASTAKAERVRASYAGLPLAFEPNEGQADPQVKYLARSTGYTVFLTQNEAWFSFSDSSSLRTQANIAKTSGLMPLRQTVHHATRAAAVNMRLAGGNARPQLISRDTLPGKINYLLGNDPAKWHTGVPQYARVSYNSVYPGVDLVYYGDRSKLEFDFILAPDSDPSPIAFAFGGAQGINTDAAGDLVVRSAAGNLVLHKPKAYQQRNGWRENVDTHFVLKASNVVSFALGNYDHSRQLVIDPSVTYATYLGGKKEDDAYGIAIDGAGNAYVTGQTKSTDFPTKGGVAPNTNGGGFDVFVTKLSADGSSLIYSTYVGGSGDDSGNAIAVDSSGDAFVTGGTKSTDFPTTNGAFQTIFGTKTGMATLDTFVFELNSAGNGLTYSTFIGGNGDDIATGIAIDASGAYVAGSTQSTNFPTQSAAQGSINGTVNGFVTKLNSTGSGLVYSTYLGGGTGDFAAAIAVGGGGKAYVTGASQNDSFPTTNGVVQPTCNSCDNGTPDAFVTVFDSTGAISYSTFLGGSGIDQGLGIAVDSSGRAYVTGLTQSSDFPMQAAWQQTLAGGQNAFVTRLNATGSALDYSTFLGGGGIDGGNGITLDGKNDAYVTGLAGSPDFPLATPTQLKLGGNNDAFVSEFNPAGLLIFSTYLGGSQDEDTNAGSNLSLLGSVAVDSTGANLYAAGNTSSSDFPTVAPEQSADAGGIDAFVAKYALPTGPDFSISASNPDSVSPGTSGTTSVELIALNGYSSSVTLSCSVSGGGTPAPSCSANGAFSTNPVTPTVSGATTTLSITTTGNNGSSSSLSRPRAIFYAAWLPIGGLSLLGAGFGSSRSRRKKLFGFVMIGVAMASLFIMPACSSSSSRTTITGGCTTCTVPGSYTIKITGSDGTTTHSTQVTLIVT